MPVNLDGDDASSRDYTIVSEATPLLQSETSSQTSRTGSVSGSSAPQNGSPPNIDSDEPNVKVSGKRGISIIISVYILIFLQAANMSGMTMAQSTIAADLDAYESATWFTSSYLIALSSVGPLAGRFSAIFSPRLVILITSVFFVIGGLVSSQAHSLSVFILGRVLTGTGGAGIFVTAMILVLELTGKRKRGLFVGLVNTGFTTGVSLGALVSGGLIPITGWRFLFLIQTPLAALAGLGVYFSLPKSFRPGKGGKDISVSTKLKRIDYLGAVMLTGTLVLFLYGLSGTVQIVPILVSIGTLIVFILVECFWASDPIIPLAVLQSRAALLACFSQLGFMTARWTILFYAPITALAVFGFSPGASGSMLIPTNLGFGMGGLIVGWLHVKRSGSFWAACLVSIFLFGLSMFTLSFISSPSMPTWIFVGVLFANGLCTGATLNYTLAHMLHLTPTDTHYIATSLLGTFRGFAGSFGSALGGGIFFRALQAGLEKGFKTVDDTERLSYRRQLLIKKLIGSPALVYNGGLGDVDQQVAVQGYVAGLKVLFQAAVVLVCIVLVLQAATGWKGPKDQKDDEEEVREVLVEGDPEYEA
ncbi:putative Major facilitator superfamily domain-containing protein [Seiridium unicorne]|uniref:Major facilitator superfamily domain-containing protein n=1 Tax=Seiridium unicorne TaxID=138068 RepID=A0ABR2VF79_9PEZI